MKIKVLTEEKLAILDELYTWFNENYIEVSDELEKRLERSLAHAEYRTKISLYVLEGIVPAVYIKELINDTSYLDILLRYLDADFTNYKIYGGKDSSVIIFSLRVEDALTSETSYFPYETDGISKNKRIRFVDYKIEHKKFKLAKKIDLMDKVEKISCDVMILSGLLILLAAYFGIKGFMMFFIVLFLISGSFWSTKSFIVANFDRELELLDSESEKLTDTNKSVRREYPTVNLDELVAELPLSRSSRNKRN